MPNYNITVTEGYTPYTFDEMIKPLQIYKAEYDKMDAEIQDINDKASLASYYIDRKKDQDILRMHDAYMQDLNALADSFVSGGMTAEKRAAAKRLRKRYGSEISNILVAAQERQKEIEEQRQALLKNPNLRFSRNAQDTGLSFYYKNPARDPYTPYDLEQIAKQATEAAALVSNSYPTTFNIEQAKDPNGNIIPGYKVHTKVKGPGVSAAEVMSHIDNYSNYKDAKNRVLIATGYNDIKDDTLKKEVLNAVNSGFAKGIITASDSGLVQDRARGTSGRTPSGGPTTGAPNTKGRVTLSSQNRGVVSQNQEKTMKEAKETIGDKEGISGRAISLAPTETKRRAEKLTNIDSRLLTVTTPKLEQLWKEYENAEKEDFSIINEEEVKKAAEKGSLGVGAKALSRIFGRIDNFEEGLKTIGKAAQTVGKWYSSNYNDAEALKELQNLGKTYTGPKFMSAEEKKEKVLKEIEKEYKETWDTILNLPGANRYFSIDNLSADRINQYFSDVISSQGVSSIANYYTTPSSGVVEYFKGQVQTLNEKDKDNPTWGVYTLDGKKQKKDTVLKGEKWLPGFIPDEEGKIKIGINIDGKDYYLRGAAEINRQEEILNTTLGILRSTPVTVSSRDEKENGNILNSDGKVDNIYTVTGEEALDAEGILDAFYNSRVIQNPEDGLYYIINGLSESAGIGYSTQAAAEYARTQLPAMQLAKLYAEPVLRQEGERNLFAFRTEIANADTGKIIPKNIVIYDVNGFYQIIAENAASGNASRIAKDLEESWMTGLKFAAYQSKNESEKQAEY